MRVKGFSCCRRALAFVAGACTVASTAAAQPQTIRLTHSMEVDGTTAELMSVNAMVVSSRGEIAVTQLQTQAIAVFDGEGRHRFNFGRRGEGPGEFRNIRYLTSSKDTIWAYDATLRRFTSVTWGGRPGRTVPAPTQGVLRDSTGNIIRGMALVLGMAGNQFYAVFVPSSSTVTPRFVVMDAGGAVQRQIGEVPDSEDPRFSYFHRLDGGSLKGRVFPFTYRPEAVVSADGARAAHISVDHTSRSMRVLVVSAQGVPAFERAYRFEPIPIPRATLDSALKEVTADLRRPMSGMGGGIASSALDAAAREWERRARQNIPASYPPIEAGAVLGEDGVLWIPLRREGLSTRRYYALDARGNPLGVMELPADVIVMAVSADAAWGYRLDDTHVPSLHRYNVRR
jgi:hypothetical protein